MMRTTKEPLCCGSCLAPIDLNDCAVERKHWTSPEITGYLNTYYCSCGALLGVVTEDGFKALDELVTKVTKERLCKQW